MSARLDNGQRVRIAGHVRRDAWNVPTSWAGMEVVVRGGGGRVSGLRLYRVGFDDCETTAEFAECVLQPVQPVQSELFSERVKP